MKNLIPFFMVLFCNSALFAADPIEWFEGTDEKTGQKFSNQIVGEKGYIYYCDANSRCTVLSLHPVDRKDGTKKYSLFLGLKPDPKKMIAEDPYGQSVYSAVMKFYLDPKKDFSHFSPKQAEMVSSFTGKQFTAAERPAATVPQGADNAADGVASHGAGHAPNRPAARPASSGGSPIDRFNNWKREHGQTPPADTEDLTKWISANPLDARLVNKQGEVLDEVKDKDVRVLDDGWNCVTNDGTQEFPVHAVFVKKNGGVAFDIVKKESGKKLSESLKNLKEHAMLLETKEAGKKESQPTKLVGSDPACVSRLSPYSRKVDVRWKDGVPVIEYAEGGQQYFCKRFIKSTKAPTGAAGIDSRTGSGAESGSPDDEAYRNIDPNNPTKQSSYD